MRTNTPQYRHLRDRINTAQSRGRWWRMEDRKKRKEPASVRNARRIVKRWDAEGRRMAEKHDAKLNKLAQAAQTAILFKEEREALRAVERFEKVVANLNR